MGIADLQVYDVSGYILKSTYMYEYSDYKS